MGFTTTSGTQFDGAEVVFNSGVNLFGGNQVYYPVLIKYAAGTTPPCNTVTKLTLPAYPVDASQSTSGISLFGSITNVQNVVDTDPNNYATIAWLADVASRALVSVEDVITTYPANTYACLLYTSPSPRD